MSDLAKRNEHGRRAEYRTEGFLLDHFWVFKISVDLDGAAFLVQPATRSAESLHHQTTTQPFAVVQSFAYGAGAEVEIARLLVEQPDCRAQQVFFASIHTVDRSGRDVDFFFSADEVQSVFKPTKNQSGQDVFVFAITGDRNFSQFQRNCQDRLGMIAKALVGATLERDKGYLSQVFELLGSGSVRPLLVQVSRNQWQIRHRESIYEFDLDENSIVHGWRTDPSGKREIAPLLVDSSLDDYEFDLLSQEWIHHP